MKFIKKYELYDSDIDLSEDDYIIKKTNFVIPTLFLYEIVKIEIKTKYIVYKQLYQYSINDSVPVNIKNGYYDKVIYDDLKKELLYKTDNLEDAKKMMVILLKSEQKYNL